MIDKEQILLLTQGGLNVFSHFLGFEVNLHRNFRSPFYDDRRPSCHFYYYRKRFSYKFFYHGGTHYSGGCFLFFATLCGFNSERLAVRRVGEECSTRWSPAHLQKHH